MRKRRKTGGQCTHFLFAGRLSLHRERVTACSASPAHTGAHDFVSSSAARGRSPLLKPVLDGTPLAPSGMLFTACPPLQRPSHVRFRRRSSLNPASLRRLVDLHACWDASGRLEKKGRRALATAASPSLLLPGGTWPFLHVGERLFPRRNEKGREQGEEDGFFARQPAELLVYESFAHLLT